jgi:hypothetical protein
LWLENSQNKRQSTVALTNLMITPVAENGSQIGCVGSCRQSVLLTAAEKSHDEFCRVRTLAFIL